MTPVACTNLPPVHGSLSRNFALNVFEELGLVEFSEGKLVVYRGVKADLKNSAIYRKILALREE